MITINSLKKMQKYYNKPLNTYIFDDDVEFTINIDVESDIKALDIKAYDISAKNIKAFDIDAYNINANDIKAQNIDALDINAQDINYYACCIAYYTFKCKSAKGRRDNSICKCLDSKIEYIK